MEKEIIVSLADARYCIKSVLNRYGFTCKESSYGYFPRMEDQFVSVSFSDSFPDLQHLKEGRNYCRLNINAGVRTMGGDYTLQKGIINEDNLDYIRMFDQKTHDLFCAVDELSKRFANVLIDLDVK